MCVSSMYVYVRCHCRCCPHHPPTTTQLPHTNLLRHRLTQHLTSSISDVTKSPVCTLLGHDGTLRLNRIQTFRKRSSYFISRVDMKARRTVRSDVRDPTELQRCENFRRERGREGAGGGEKERERARLTAGYLKTE